MSNLHFNKAEEGSFAAFSVVWKVFSALHDRGEKAIYALMYALT